MLNLLAISSGNQLRGDITFCTPVVIFAHSIRCSLSLSLVKEVATEQGYSNVLRNRCQITKITLDSRNEKVLFQPLKALSTSQLSFRFPYFFCETLFPLPFKSDTLVLGSYLPCLKVKQLFKI